MHFEVEGKAFKCLSRADFATYKTIEGEGETTILPRERTARGFLSHIAHVRSNLPSPSPDPSQEGVGGVYIVLSMFCLCFVLFMFRVEATVEPSFTFSVEPTSVFLSLLARVRVCVSGHKADELRFRFANVCESARRGNIKQKEPTRKSALKCN